MGANALRLGPIGPNALHLCVDMQSLFAAGSPWAMTWMERVLPQVERLCALNPQRTLFTRFLPPVTAEEARGIWRLYYRKWQAVTLEQIGAEAVDIHPALRRFIPPAQVIDKRAYSPWLDPALDRLLVAGKIDTLVLSGGETDVCVLATALGAVDRGYRVVLAEDALCSSADETHEAVLRLYQSRFDLQIELASTDELLENWIRD